MNSFLSRKKIKIGIIGLGYVGLPLAVEFGKKFDVIGYDLNKIRINELKKGFDSTFEIETKELKKSKKLTFTTSDKRLSSCNVYIVTVPTPVNENKQPDLSALLNASKMIGRHIGKNNVVVYESTVYPGATEEDCVPLIEKISKLKFNEDFFVGYSPERINPGDKKNKLINITKVTSGSNAKTADFVDALYKKIIKAGTFKASSIKVAEGAKIIENVQRDVNIALVNEFHQIFTHLEIDTNEVIEAASSKWNFMKLKPGLVGGHCIGVDPYYLLHKSESKGFMPDLMRTGREINDSMSNFLVNDFIKRLLVHGINPVQLNVALVGFAFKENCSDIRNTKIKDVYLQLKQAGFSVKIYDSLINQNEVKKEYNLDIETDLSQISEKVIFLGVGHDEILNFLKKNNFDFVYDFKSLVKN